MPPVDLTREAFDQALAQVIEEAEESRRDSLREIVTARAAEADVFVQAADHLRPGLGAGHPSVLELEAAARLARDIATWAEHTLDLAEKGPGASPRDWIITGRGEGARGTTGDGLTARVVDSGGNAIEGTIGRVTLDGDFVLRVPSDVLARVGDAEFYVEVTDAAGRAVFRSEQPVRGVGGRVDVVSMARTGRTRSPAGPALRRRPRRRPSDS